MSQFFQKIAQFLANEVVTKRLANSPTFMNAAHKTHQHVQKSKQILSETKETAGAQAKSAGAQASAQAKETGTSAFGFLAEVRRELFK